MKRFVVLQWVVFLSTAIFFSSPALAQDPLTQFCQDLLTQKQSPGAPSSAPGFWSKLGFFLDPASAVGVAELGKDGQLQKTVAAHDEDGQVPVAIFTPDFKNKGQDTQPELEELKTLQQSFSDFDSTYTEKIRNSSSLESCLQTASQLGLTDAVLEKYEADLNKFFSQQDAFVDQQVPGQIQSLKSDFDFVYSVTAANYMDIQSQIAALDQTGNKTKIDIVLVFHGAEDGSVYDLSGLVVPPSFFDALAHSQSIRNVVIYACYSDETVKFYHEALVNLVSQGVGLYVGVNQGILAGYGPMVSNLFPDFIEKYLGYSTQ